MRRFLLLYACCLSLAASAAIITERNDLNIYPPDYATFVGSASHPGIDSCWIPYGTYTDGSGSTEYLRVTSNLVGVVCSAFDGCIERQYYWYQPGDRYLLYPTTNTAYYSRIENVDEFLEPFLLTNNTTRILDLLNTMDRRRYWLRQDSNSWNPEFYATQYGEYPMLEQYLAREETEDDTYWGGTKYQYHAGIAAEFGGRKLDALASAEGASIEPPIPSEWTSDLPFKAADSNLWATVWPTYSALTNDIHFYPDMGEDVEKRNYRSNLDSWIYSIDDGIWGYDVRGVDYSDYWNPTYYPGNGDDLLNALIHIPLPFTMEDVLSADTGLKYDLPSPKLTNDYWTVNGIQLNRWYCEPSDGWSNLNHSSADWDGADSNQWYAVAWYSDSRRWQYAESSTGVSIYVDASPNATQIDFGNGIIATKTEFYADTDDYIHWTNGTTRLDWKRLGIICQLERQMDTTYESYQYGDTLPLWHLDTLHELWYESSPVSITFPMPQGDGQEMPPVAGLLRNVSWNNDYDYYSSTTNDYKTIWSTPTCRTPAPQCAGEMYFDGYLGTDIYLEYEDASNIVSKICSELSQSITGELSHVRFYGDWHPGAGMNLDFNAYYAEGTVIIKHPSNTVEVTSSDGFHAGGWTYDDVDRHDWDFTNGTTRCDVRFDYGNAVPGGTYIYYRDTEPYGESVYYEDNLHFGLKSGSITVPQVTLSAIGSGMITNWTWQVSGLPNVPTNLVSGLPSVSYSYVEMADGTVYTNLHCRWAIGNYADSFGTGGYVLYQGLIDAGDGSITWHLQSDDVWQGSTYVFQWIMSEDAALSHSYASPSITLTWNADYYTTEEEVFYSGPLQGDSIPIQWNAESTNVTGYAFSTIHKTTSPTFTFASPETRELTISNFSWKNSPLDWDRIHSLRRSELELLLSARGVPGFASDTNAYSITDQPFTWEAIKNIPHSDRMFRMLQGTESTTLSNADNAQYNFLASLSSICKQECEEIGGMPIGAIDEVGKVSQSESAAFLADFNNAKVGATFSISGSSGQIFDADVHLEGDSYVVDAIYTPGHFPYYVGGCGWDCYVDYQQSASITNQYRDARVDAHQAPVRKAVWKFKNLRDPNL